MAENPQVHSSFIPKKTLSKGLENRKSPMGFLTVLAVIIFFLAVLGWVGMFFYAQRIDDQVAQLEESLGRAQDSFEPELLRDFRELDKKLRAGESLINRHTTLVPFFFAMEQLTLVGVQFDTVEYSRGFNSHTVNITGRAVDFPAIALQADELAEDRRILNPVFSGFRRVDDETNRVEFDLSFSVNPTSVLYANTFDDN